MTFTILGTAAAEGWPGLWCPCEACATARELGGKNIRRRTAYQIGERIHVDFGPDSYAQMLQFGLDYHRLEHLLITHSHADHLCAQELHYRGEGFVPEPIRTLHIYGNATVGAQLAALEHPLDESRARFIEIEPFSPLDLGDGVIATPLEADHASDDEQALIYLFEREGRALLQANDTGIFPESTWEFLATRQLDVVVIECTYGPREGGRHHLGAGEVIEVRQRLLKLGVLKPDARMIATHFSHNGGWLHDQLEDHFASHEIEVAFDGMQIDL